MAHPEIVKWVEAAQQKGKGARILSKTFGIGGIKVWGGKGQGQSIRESFTPFSVIKDVSLFPEPLISAGLKQLYHNSVEC